MPFTCDRTEEFARLRAELAAQEQQQVPTQQTQRPNKDASVILVDDLSPPPPPPASAAAAPAASVAAVEMTQALPAWLCRYHKVRDALAMIAAEQVRIEALQRRHLLVEFGVNRDREGEAREIDEMMRAMLTKFETADADLKALKESYIEECLSGPDGGSQLQRRILHNVTQCLASELSNLNRAVRESHRRYVKLLEQRAAALRSGGVAAIEEWQQGLNKAEAELIEQDEAERSRTQETVVGTVLDRVDADMDTFFDPVAPVWRTVPPPDPQQQFAFDPSSQRTGPSMDCCIIFAVVVMGALEFYAKYGWIFSVFRDPNGKS